jgi:hypothetical protein
MLRIGLRVLVLVVIASLSAVVIAMAIDSTKPSLVPQALGQAESAAARGAVRRGESSFCGIEIPVEFRGHLTPGGALVIATTGSVVPLASCLRDQGYLSSAGFDAVQRYEDEQTWRWWDKAVWALILVAVAGFAGLLMHRRGSFARRSPESS